MRLRMAIHAVLPEQKLRWNPGWQSAGVLRDAWMARLTVATLAQEGPAASEHAGVIRSVRRMAKAAVFADGRVLPEVRAALFRVALQARVICRLSHEIRTDVVVMHGVAGNTVHLALRQRVRERFQRLRSLPLVTVIAHLRLCGGLQNGIPGRMAAMAVGACHFVVAVHIGMPSQADAVVMAFETHGILDSRLGCIKVTEADDWWTLLAASDTSGMFVTRPMAGLALQLAMAEGSARVARYSVLRLEYRKCYGVFMTREAGVRAFTAVVTVRRLRVGFARGQQPRYQQSRYQ